MVNYQQGKIYKISAGDQLYVGSTTRRYLCQRWVRHKYAFKCQTSKLYREMRRVGLENCSKCILVEKFPCKSKDELRAREDYWRIKLRASLNEQSAYGESKESVQNQTEYRYQIIECRCGAKTWRSHLQRHQRTSACVKYHTENGLEIRGPVKRKKSGIKCPCGGQYTTRYVRHCATKRHQKYMKSKAQDLVASEDSNDLSSNITCVPATPNSA